MNRRSFLAATVAAPFVGVDVSGPAPTPTPLDQLRARYRHVAVNPCPEGWWVWAGDTDRSVGARAATIDDACAELLDVVLVVDR